MAEKKPKKVEVPMTKEELAEAQFNRDQTEMNLSVLEFNIKQANRQIELNLPIREMKQQVKRWEAEVERNKMNKKAFDKQIRTGKRTTFEYPEDPIEQ